ncbi:hypothetical protein ERO13_D10G063750v2 [Gossypium hirsutum]|nr:hypothetical protein ERO13_D10G063750v2 [Gossypium hirsutum]
MSSLLLQFLGFLPKFPLFPSFVFPFWSSKNRGMYANVVVVMSYLQHVEQQKDLKWLMVWVQDCLQFF